MVDQSFIDSLAHHYGDELSNAFIQPRSLPLVPEIQLYLLLDSYPRHSLGQAAYYQLMSAPPYWAFCWGGGQAMARYLIDHSHVVKGKAVMDLGAGSGVAGLAAAIAGASRVIGVDIDPLAVAACEANARLNKLEMAATREFSDTGFDIMLAADICYEEEGMELVQSYLAKGGDLLVADSRIEQLAKHLPGVHQVHEIKVKTFPDLDEHSSFDTVRLYSTL